MVFNIAVVGLGKIANDQHLPCIAKNGEFKFVACVSRNAKLETIPCFESLSGLIESGIPVDAVALCTPPSVRLAMARQVLDAGLDLLIEKPPTPTVGEFYALVEYAKIKKRVLFATWHSRYNRAVDEAKLLLGGKRIARLKITWHENVRRWHPNQEWIWEPGGFGVFDPGINALSVVTKIMPEEIFVESAVIEVPANKATPIAAQIKFKTGDGSVAEMSADFDWRQKDVENWEIEIETKDGIALKLQKGGTVLVVNGKTIMQAPMEEYEMIYAHFAELLKTRQSEADVRPLQLVCDCFMLGRPKVVEAFV